MIKITVFVENSNKIREWNEGVVDTYGVSTTLMNVLHDFEPSFFAPSDGARIDNYSWVVKVPTQNEKNTFNIKNTFPCIVLTDEGKYIAKFCGTPKTLKEAKDFFTTVLKKQGYLPNSGNGSGSGNNTAATVKKALPYALALLALPFLFRKPKEKEKENG